MRLLFVFICLALAMVSARPKMVYKAGRAFPRKSREYVKKRFAEVNKNLQWDTTNHLEKLATNFTSCAIEKGIIKGRANLPDNQNYVAFIEYVELHGAGETAVNALITSTVNNWRDKKRYTKLIRNATLFACSIHPGCGYKQPETAISCVFSHFESDYFNHQDYQLDEPKEEVEPETTTFPRDQPAPIIPTGNIVSFTKEQYKITEDALGVRWDRTHFLENLSGMETSCEMLHSDWEFKESQKYINYLRLQRVQGMYGWTSNDGASTPDALDVILREFRRRNSIGPGYMIGCTMITDCIHKDRTKMVVSCLYQEDVVKKIVAESET